MGFSSRQLKRAPLWLGVGILLAVSRAQARPTAPALLCEAYPESPACAGKLASCNLCHASIDPPAWNSYGTALRDALDRSRSFEDGLTAALHQLDDADSDGDGLSNRDELAAGTGPGDAESVAAQPLAASEYDLAFAFRRVHTLYCGQSPSYQERKDFAALAGDPAAARTRLHEAVDRCLGSDYWQKDALLRLADKRIKPQASLGPDTQLRLGRLRPVLGDYRFDYRLWRFIMTGDRDMRELLTADYHVLEAEDGSLKQTRELIQKPDPNDLGGGQPLKPEYRAGMITTQWFLHSNTMVSALPRTTAAQAYRAYLGADISAMEGLVPVDGEPADVDHKGVQQARCARCHSTLDPLSYAFAKYEGAPSGRRPTMMTMMTMMTTPGSPPMQPAGQYDILANIGGYNPDRPSERIPDWDDAKQQPYLFGQRVDGLVGLARAAVASDEFKRNLVDIFFRHALGGEPSQAQQPEFDALWRSLPDDGFSANRLIHRLVDSHSFGAP